MEILLIILLVLVALNILFTWLFRAKGDETGKELGGKVDALDKILSKIETNLKDDFRVNREENAKITKENRTELNDSLKEFRTEMTESLKAITKQNQEALEKLNTTLETKITALIEKTDTNNKTNREEQGKSLKEFSEANSSQLEKINKQVEEKLKALTDQAKADSDMMRKALVDAFKGFQETFDAGVKSFNDLQREKFSQMEIKQNELVLKTEEKLEKMRETVDEKLQKTLNERLSQSFEQVGKQLESVQKGLGEMQTLAQDVGGLKNALSNVKMRGGIGEVQLAMLLEQILAPDQYEANVKTKKGSSDMVEFAVKMPGPDREGSIYVPIDAKFPKDAYAQLQTAYDSADATLIEAAQKVLENTIRKMAKDISDKYLDPPYTSDFGIMFLPFEGIYAEVVRKASLLEDLQKNYKVVVTGPTTLAAILHSFHMGFRTLAIQKRSSEVWNILGAIKTEFEKFGGLLDKAYTQITSAGATIDLLKGTRTNAINRKLRDVTALPAAEAKKLIPEVALGEFLDEETENGVE